MQDSDSSADAREQAAQSAVPVAAPQQAPVAAAEGGAGLVGTAVPARKTGAFTSAVLALGGGAAVSHLIAFVCAPIVSRLFGPEAFGAASIFSAVVLIVGVASSLRYEAALMLPARDEDAANLLALSFLCVAAVSGLMAVAVALGGDQLARVVNVEAMATYKWLLPVGVFTWGIGLPLRSWVTRHKKFKTLAAINAVETSTLSGIRIAAGSAGFHGAGPLIVSSIVARSVQPAILAGRLLIRDLRFLTASIRPRRIAALAREYAGFALVDSWSAVLAQLSGQLPFVLLGASLGEAIAGHYNRAVLLCQVPFLLAGNSVRQVFFQRAAAIQAVGKPVDDLVEQVVDRLIWVTLLPLALLAVIGPELLTVVLGPQWRQAGGYSQLLACWLFLEGISMPLSGLISVLRILGVGLAFRASLVIGQIASIVIGGWVLKSNFASVLLLACSGAAVHATMIVFMLRASGVPLKRAGWRLLRYLAYAAPTLAVAAAANWWLRLRDWQVVAAAAAASVSYVALVLRHDAWARERLWGILGRVVALAGRALGK